MDQIKTEKSVSEKDLEKKAMKISERNRQIINDRKIEETPTQILVKDLNLWYDDFQALKNINMDIKKGKITAFIGPSGCGKSTTLKCFNRMNDLVDSCRIEGLIEIEGQDIYKKDVDVVNLRRNVGMVFQAPNPFSKSVYENIIYESKVTVI